MDVRVDDVLEEAVLGSSREDMTARVWKKDLPETTRKPKASKHEIGTSGDPGNYIAKSFSTKGRQRTKAESESSWRDQGVGRAPRPCPPPGVRIWPFFASEILILPKNDKYNFSRIFWEDLLARVDTYSNSGSGSSRCPCLWILPKSPLVNILFKRIARNIVLESLTINHLWFISIKWIYLDSTGVMNFFNNIWSFPFWEQQYFITYIKLSLLNSFIMPLLIFFLKQLGIFISFTSPFV